MAPFSIPAPSIIPLRVPVFGGPRAIDTLTKIELSCDTQLEHEIFYTLDGTRPQPYAGIVQGSKLYKYKSPVCLPAGKISIKALALNAIVHSMRSSIITKTFEVLQAETDTKDKNSPCKTKKTRRAQMASNTNGVDGEDCGSTFDLENFNREDIYDPTEEFPTNFIDDSSAEDALESPSEVCSFASVQERINDTGIEEDSFLYETENLSDGERDTKDKDEAFISDYTREECDADDNGRISEENIFLETRSVSDPVKFDSDDERHNGGGEKSLYCMKCEALLQHCSSCHTLSAVTSKFCIQCGQKLLHECKYCKELNSVIATFCQSCGRKLEVENRRPQPISFTDCSTMAQPQRHHAYVQQSLVTDDKQTQTASARKEGERASGDFRKRLSSHSPGRGYWRQQLDYVCNHLKSYAYNNVEFRDSISEPMLSEFQSVEVVKSEDGVSITVVFSPYMMENGAKNSD